MSRVALCAGQTLQLVLPVRSAYYAIQKCGNCLPNTYVRGSTVRRPDFAAGAASAVRVLRHSGVLSAVDCLPNGACSTKAP